jgi:hypothetical protein
MKCTVEMDSYDMLYITSLINIGSSIQEYSTMWFNNPIFIFRQPLWSIGQSSWLQIQRSGFDSLCYQIF